MENEREMACEAFAAEEEDEGEVETEEDNCLGVVIDAADTVAGLPAME